MKFSRKLILILTFAINITAQIVTVKDEITNVPLEFVTITSERPRVISVTNSSGQTKITSFRGSDKITIQLLGYEKNIKSFKEIIENNYLIYLSPSNISLDQVVISATKWSQSNKEIPSRISSITSKEVMLQNPQTTADLLAISGEVFIQKSQQGGGSPMIRGFATNRVLISVDGIRMNNAIFRSGNIQNVISMDPFTIENTEVLFGPGSIIYGSDAIGGSMNFYTLRPQFSLSDDPFIKSYANYRFASANNENTGHFHINFGLTDLAFLTSISYYYFGNLQMGSSGPQEYLRNEFVKSIQGIDQIVKNDNSLIQNPTKYNQLNLMQKIRYSPNDNWYIDYGFHYSTTSNYDRYDRLIRYRNDLPRSAEWYYGPQKWMMNNLTITKLKSSVFYDDLAIRLAHQLFEESRNDRDFRDTELRIREERVNAYSVNLDFNKSLNSISKINYGIEGVYNKVSSEGRNKTITNNIFVNAPSRYPNSNWLSLAGYLIYQNNLRSDLLFQSGLRYNYYSLKSDFDTTFFPLPFTSSNLSNGAVTGSLGLVYTPNEKWSIQANLSTGFRSPNVDDIGKVFDSEPGAVVVPNPKLNAEYAYNAEFGIAKVIDNFIKIDLSAYYTYLENALVRRDFSLNGIDSIYYNNELSQVQAVQNAANAYVWGIQAGIDLSFSNNFSFSSKINYQKGEEELDDGTRSPLRHAAPLFGYAALEFKNSKINSILNIIYNGEISYNNLAEEERGKTYMYAVDKNGNPYSPSWYILNLKITYSLNENIAFSGGIENITDRRYKYYSSGIAAAGRNFIISTRFNL